METRKIIEDKIKIAQGLKLQKDGLDSKTRSDQKKIALLQQILTAHASSTNVVDLGEEAVEAKVIEGNSSFERDSFTGTDSLIEDYEAVRLGVEIIDVMAEIEDLHPDVTD